MDVAVLRTAGAKQRARRGCIGDGQGRRIGIMGVRVIGAEEPFINQVFELLRLSLAVALQHGFMTVLLFSIAALVATFFLKDVPMTQQQPDMEADEEREANESEVDVSVMP